MNVLVVVKNTTKLTTEDWTDFTAEVADCIKDHAVRITSVKVEPGEVSWVADFLENAGDLAIARAALTAIASKPGGEYAWLAVTEAGVTV